MSRRAAPAVEPEGALYVKLPAIAVDKLDRAAEALGIRKKDLVATLIARHVDPDSQQGLQALGTAVLAGAGPRRITTDDVRGPTPTLGAYSFQVYEPGPPPEVMTVEQTAELLQVDIKTVLELVEAGELPGRRLGKTWRFSRAAVIAWLGTPER